MKVWEVRSGMVPEGWRRRIERWGGTITSWRVHMRVCHGRNWKARKMDAGDAVSY